MTLKRNSAIFRLSDYWHHFRLKSITGSIWPLSCSLPMPGLIAAYFRLTVRQQWWESATLTLMHLTLCTYPQFYSQQSQGSRSYWLSHGVWAWPLAQVGVYQRLRSLESGNHSREEAVLSVSDTVRAAGVSEASWTSCVLRITCCFLLRCESAVIQLWRERRGKT